MKFLLMRLKGPMQSWGANSRFSLRDSGNFPTQSGVFGIIGAAMGYTRDSEELIDLLSPLAVAVRIDKAGRRMRDYQIIDTGSKGKKISERFYLSDADFLVSVYDPENKSDELLKRISDSLERPKNTLFLGRKSCPPTEKINLGIHKYDTVIASMEGFFQYFTNTCDAMVSVGAWIPGNSGKHAMMVQDVPISFSTRNRSYSTRLISNVKIELENPHIEKSFDPFEILQEEV